MSDIREWDPVDANNQAAPPDGFPEGQPAKSLNDSSRAVMGAVRRQWEDREWFDYGHDATYINPNQFTVPGDESATYKINRRCRCVGTNTGTVYGTISGVAVATDTTVTLTMDGSSVVQVEIDDSERVSVGSDPDAGSIAPSSVAGLAELIAAAAVPIGGLVPFGGTVAPSGYLLCDGSAYNAATNTEYQPLYDVIGNAFGGSDNTDFQVPDARNRALVGVGALDGTGATASIGVKQGAEETTLVLGNLPNINGRNPASDQPDANRDIGGASTFTAAQGVNTNIGGSSTPFNNRAPELPVGMIIKF